MYSAAVRRVVGLIACVVMLLSGFVPLLPHASARAGDDSMSSMEICGADGIRMIQVGSDEAPASSHHSHGDHCPFCSHPGQVPVLASASPQWLQPVALSEGMPRAFLQAPVHSPVWLPAQSRGPPAIA